MSERKVALVSGGNRGIGAAIVAVVDAVLLIAGRPWEQVLSITWVALLLLSMVLTGQQL